MKPSLRSLLRGLAVGWVEAFRKVPPAAAPAVMPAPVEPTPAPADVVLPPAVEDAVHEALVLMTSIRIAHSRISFLLDVAEIPLDGRAYLVNSLSVLCWLIGCPNQSFLANMCRISKALTEQKKHLGGFTPVTRGFADGARKLGLRFIVIAQPLSIQCLTCLHASTDADDINNLFCPKCKVFHDELLAADLDKLEAWASAQSPDAGA